MEKQIDTGFGFSLTRTETNYAKDYKFNSNGHEIQLGMRIKNEEALD